jgi:hypothetical protein
MNYWLYEGDQITGPFSLADIQQMVDREKLKPEDRICRNGETDWHESRELRELDFGKAKASPTASIETPAPIPVAEQKQTATGLLAAIIIGLIGFGLLWAIFTAGH